MNETVHFLKTQSKRHGSKVAWTTIMLALLGLATAALQQRETSSNNHTAIWVKANGMEARIEMLEKAAEYDKGYRDALAQAAKVNEEHLRNLFEQPQPKGK